MSTRMLFELRLPVNFSKEGMGLVVNMFGRLFQYSFSKSVPASFTRIIEGTI
jgi:hypothetical protein